MFGRYVAAPGGKGYSHVVNRGTFRGSFRFGQTGDERPTSTHFAAGLLCRFVRFSETKLCSHRDARLSQQRDRQFADVNPMVRSQREDATAAQQARAISASPGSRPTASAWRSGTTIVQVLESGSMTCAAIPWLHWPLMRLPPSRSGHPTASTWSMALRTESFRCEPTAATSPGR